MIFPYVLTNINAYAIMNSMKSEHKNSDSHTTKSELEKFKLGFEFDVLEKDIKNQIKQQIIIRKPPVDE